MLRLLGITTHRDSVRNAILEVLNVCLLCYLLGKFIEVYFDKRLGLATGVAAAGAGLGIEHATQA